MILELPDEVYEHLRNIVTWAALWDATRNRGKNRAVYDQVLPYVLPEMAAGEEDGEGVKQR